MERTEMDALSTPATPLTLAQLTARLGRAITATPGLTGQWVTAETSDLRVSGGHCYMELVQKDPASGRPVAKIRAVIWASTFARLGAAFTAVTGARLASDMKVLVRVDTNFHSIYGLSLVITDINPEYTVGDLARRRAEILAMLRREGVAELNRNLPWSAVPLRIAVVSAAGAAGYGDFMRHLHTEGRPFRFSTTLFAATMQGTRTAASVIAAMEEIAAREEEFDCVVIIRGGGAVTDLTSFDDYDLAANVAQFPLPVVVGIGHERDQTVLDFIASRTVKTPTAAAELLIGAVGTAYQRLLDLGRDILSTTRARLSGAKEQLAYIQGTLPALVRNRLALERRRTGADTSRQLAREVRLQIERQRQRLEAAGALTAALSPEATLRRGFSITRTGGHAVTDGEALSAGTVLETTFADGAVRQSTLN